MRFYFIILALSAFFAVPNAVIAESPRLLSLHQIISNADLIARGKVVKKEPIKITFNEKTKTCGWAIHFDIFESYKGEDSNVILFINSDEFITDLDQEHLIVAFKTTETDDDNMCFYPFENFINQQATDNSEPQRVQEFKFSDLPVTKVSAYPYRVRDWEGLFPIDQYSSSKYGDTWMMYLDRMSGVRISYKPIDLEIRQVKEGENIDHRAKYKIIRYEDFIQKLIIETPE
tara:strand:- start:268394 stop:269086 length:693 start_codon:yes stop_codon:yes gene_type:complete